MAKHYNNIQYIYLYIKQRAILLQYILMTICSIILHACTHTVDHKDSAVKSMYLRHDIAVRHLLGTVHMIL